MHESKAHIIARLQKEILPLQGFKNIQNDAMSGMELGPMKYAFPHQIFPTGAIHEFFCGCPEDTAATSGFIAALLATLMRSSGVAIWIGSTRNVFPPALVSFGITSDKIIFIDLNKEKEVVWAMEEALKCDGIAAVISEIAHLDFIASRRLQLAVEQSSVTGFIIRCNPRNLNTACIARWKISPIQSIAANDLPGVGFPAWQVELLKIRNGKPGNWQIAWAVDQFRYITNIGAVLPVQQKKTG
jgi:protein ImuA